MQASKPHARSGTMSGPPKGAPWVWLTRDLLRSASWQSLGINARRLVDFLLIEHMNHVGRDNGFLLAPRWQLEEFGIGRRLISGAIEEAKASGLVAVRRGTGRRPSTFTLTWLPVVAGHEGVTPRVHEGERQGRSRARRCTAKAEIEGARRCTPYRSSYQDRGYITDVYSGEAEPQARAAMPAPQPGRARHTRAGKPAGSATR